MDRRPHRGTTGRRDPARRQGFTAAQSDADVRAALLAVARGKLTSEAKIVDVAMAGTLIAHLEGMPKPVAEVTVVERPPPLPVIVMDGPDAASVIRYTPLLLRAMTDTELHAAILTMMGATYIDEIKCWGCAHPDFPEVMRSISRSMDHTIEGLQPDMAQRYLTTVRLERQLLYPASIEAKEALVEWEEIAAQDDWTPSSPEQVYHFTHAPQGDTTYAPEGYSKLSDIVEAEMRDGYQNEVETWNGTWTRDGQQVHTTEIRQAIVLATWGIRVSEARDRIAKGESACGARDRLYAEQHAHMAEMEARQQVKNAWKRRRAKFGDNN